MKKKGILFLFLILCLYNTSVKAETLTLSGAQQFIIGHVNLKYSSITSMPTERYILCPHGNNSYMHQWEQTKDFSFAYYRIIDQGTNNTTSTVNALNTAIGGYACGYIDNKAVPNQTTSDYFNGIIYFNNKPLAMQDISKEYTSNTSIVGIKEGETTGVFSVQYSGTCTQCTNAVAFSKPTDPKTLFTKIATGTKSYSDVVFNNCIFKGVNGAHRGLESIRCSVNVIVNGGNYTGAPAFKTDGITTVNFATIVDESSKLSQIIIPETSESSAETSGSGSSKTTVTTVKKSSGSGGTVVTPTPTP